MIKELTQEENVAIVNIYAFNIRLPKYIHQILTVREILTVTQ